MAIRADRLATLVGPWLGSGPAYVGLAAGVRALALDGRLAVDARVPSERELALALALSRTTVSAAYNILRTEGYLRSDRGAGSSVSLPIASPVRPDAEPGEPRGDVLDLTVAALPAPAILVDAVAEAAGVCVAVAVGTIAAAWVDSPGQIRTSAIPPIQLACAGFAKTNRTSRTSASTETDCHSPEAVGSAVAMVVQASPSVEMSI